MNKTKLKTIHLVVLITLLVSGSLFAQEVKFKKIDKEEFVSEKYENFPDAEAAILYREETVDFDWDMQNSRFRLRRTFRERIKICSEEGYDYADYRIRLYTNAEQAKEILQGIEAFTFNLVQGKVESEKVRKENIYTEQINKYWSEVKFPMSNVKVGSILEIKYTVLSPYLFEIPKFEFQELIPIRAAKYTLNVPEYYRYKPLFQGFATVEKSRSEKRRTISVRPDELEKLNNFSVRKISSANREVEFNENILIFEVRDVPPLKKEPYVTNILNYNSAISHELVSTDFGNLNNEFYTKSWDNVATLLAKSENFGLLLRKEDGVANKISNKVASLTGIEKAKAIHATIKEDYTWNGYYGVYANPKLNDFHKEKLGNSAALNLLLIKALRKNGFDASTIVLQTRSRGFLKQNQPSVANLNHVIAELVLDDKVYYLDCTQKDLPFGFISSEANNVYAIRIKGESGSIFNLENPNSSSTVNLLSLKFEGEKLLGTRKSRFSNMGAYQQRSLLKKYQSDEERLNYLQSLDEQLKIDSCEYDIPTDKNKAIACLETIDASDYLQTIDGKIFMPLTFGMGMQNNPFESETRDFAVFFDEKLTKNISVNFEVPEGYEIEYLPKNFALALEDRAIECRVSIVRLENKVVINYILKRNATIISPDQYPNLVQMYDQIIEQLQERIVLRKI